MEVIDSQPAKHMEDVLSRPLLTNCVCSTENSVSINSQGLLGTVFSAWRIFWGQSVVYIKNPQSQ